MINETLVQFLRNYGELHRWPIKDVKNLFPIIITTMKVKWVMMTKMFVVKPTTLDHLTSTKDLNTE